MYDVDCMMFEYMPFVGHNPNLPITVIIRKEWFRRRIPVSIVTLSIPFRMMYEDNPRRIEEPNMKQIERIIHCNSSIK